jgi:hypothetical protein
MLIQATEEQNNLPLLFCEAYRAFNSIDVFENAVFFMSRDV